MNSGLNNQETEVEKHPFAFARKKTANDTHKIEKQNQKSHKHKPPIPHSKSKTKQKSENNDRIQKKNTHE